MGSEVEKLTEYRTAHYSAVSEASTYLTNQRANVSFRFANPIVCRMITGYKIMQVDQSDPFPFLPGESILVPSLKHLAIEFPFADIDQPTSCMCIEIDRDKVDDIIGRINESRRRSGLRRDVALNWNEFALYRGEATIDAQLDRLMNLYVNEHSEFRDVLIDANLGELVVYLLQSQAKRLLIETRANVPDTALDVVAHSLAQKPEGRPDPEVLARAAGMSTATFFRHFRAKFGTTPAKFVNQARVQRARALLVANGASVTEVAFEVGFQSVGHFVRVFKLATGETPGDYVRRNTRIGIRKNENPVQ
ncbi:helix-turn-helix domain-containing protein [Bradyrhizobium sp. KB893862 SZCCT0404]|nr:helix-turn-helix domain-containing protein [Bradyrhizobium sp. KB893862 SZCCT0404]